MRASVVHTAACRFHGGSLLRHSVREALSACTIGGEGRFRRVGYGKSELAPRPYDQSDGLPRGKT
jgi:hypothetical protein